MPRSWFAADFRSAGGTLLERVDRLARTYGTTPDAAAVRVGWLDLAPWSNVRPVRTAIQQRGGPKKPKGGTATSFRVSALDSFGECSARSIRAP